MVDEKIEEITEEEMELVRQHRNKPKEPAKSEKPKKSVKVTEKPEPFKEKHDEPTVTIEYDTCECGYDKLTKDMKFCPNCKGELDRESS